MSIAKRTIIVLILLSAALGVMIGKKQWTISTGTEVLLETKPIDPRSLFRGDYVRLNYMISELDLDQLPGDKEFKRNDTVYVVLTKSAPYWLPVSVHAAPPVVEPGQVFMQGTVKYLRQSRWNQESKKSEPVRLLQVRYGIENYFVQEGRGRELERPQAGKKVEMLVAVDKRGGSGIKAVLLGGVLWHRETLL